MKKFLIGLITGAILLVPVTVVAQRYTALPYPNLIYNIDHRTNAIHVFDDADNKCYVVTIDGRPNHWGDENASISCVKR